MQNEAKERTKSRRKTEARETLEFQLLALRLSSAPVATPAPTQRGMRGEGHNGEDKRRGTRDNRRNNRGRRPSARRVSLYANRAAAHSMTKHWRRAAHAREPQLPEQRKKRRKEKKRERKEKRRTSPPKQQSPQALALPPPLLSAPPWRGRRRAAPH